jgi:hypothetical protein
MDGTRCWTEVDVETGWMELDKQNRMDGDCNYIVEQFASASFVAMVCKREEIFLFFFEMEGT